MLAIDFAPEGDFSFKLLKLVHAHTEDLCVEGVQSQVNEPGNDFQGVAVGVHEHFLAVLMGDVEIIPVHGLKVSIPELGADEQRLLGAPIVHDAQAVHVGLRPLCQQPAVVVVHLLHEFQHFLRRGP